MSKGRLEYKVGLFVLIGLVLLAALLLQFSKGLNYFRSTYDIYLSTPTVAGLQKNASVLMSGVQIGTVADMRLGREGTNVVLTLRILKEYVIGGDARFVIEQSGFLGDQYVGIVPQENKRPPLQHGDTATAEAPFNFQEFTRSASQFISRVDETVKKLNDALAEVSRLLLNPETLTNLSVTAANMRTFSDRALTTIDQINGMVTTNSPSLSLSASNLVLFSEQLNQFAGDARGLLATNSEDITRTVKNIESSSASLKAVLGELQAGKGLAGNLLKDEQMAARMSQITQNLSITTSNLNRLGLWKMLWQQKPPKTNSPPGTEPIFSPKFSR
jgi:phospholipid/cholesterol/gamma-HCH transport system substrate-binding protein